MVERGSKEYLSSSRTKQHLHMPEVLANCIVNQINANGDERIDHDEFVSFFMQALMGSHEQKMMIAFNCYDADFNQDVDADEVKYVLRHCTMIAEDTNKYGFRPQEILMSKKELIKLKNRDSAEIDTIVDTIFTHYPDGMFFDEFCAFSENVSSELFYAVMDPLYHFIPCCQNFMIMRANYKKLLQQNGV